MSATRYTATDRAQPPALPPPLMDGGVLDHRIRSSSSLATGMRETSRCLNLSDVPVSESWVIGQQKPDQRTHPFRVQRAAPPAHTQYQQQFQENKGREIAAAAER